MWRGALCSILVCAAFAPIASAQSDRALEPQRRQHFVNEVDDAIAAANGRDGDRHLPPPNVDPEQWEGAGQVSTLFRHFFSGVTPNDTGIERPNPDERVIDEEEFRLDDRVSYVLMGTANDHMLTPLHFYQQFDGIHSIRYDLVNHLDGTPFRVAVFGSPLYGSITAITIHNGVNDPENRPLSIVAGAAAGLDVWYEARLVELRGRVWAMPGWDVLHDGNFGTETTQSVQMKWHLTEAFGWDHAFPIDLGVLALHVDRGDARRAVYDWPGDFRSAAELRHVWQVTAFVELRVD
jgi:hypothetical protein